MKTTDASSDDKVCSSVAVCAVSSPSAAKLTVGTEKTVVTQKRRAIKKLSPFLVHVWIFVPLRLLSIEDLLSIH